MYSDINKKPQIRNEYGLCPESCYQRMITGGGRKRKVTTRLPTVAKIEFNYEMMPPAYLQYMELYSSSGQRQSKIQLWLFLSSSVCVMMNGMRRKILASLGSLLCRCALSSLRMLNPLVYLISAETGLEQLGQLGISLILDLIIPRPSVVTKTILGAAPVLLTMQRWLYFLAHSFFHNLVAADNSIRWDNMGCE